MEKILKAKNAVGKDKIKAEHSVKLGRSCQNIVTHMKSKSVNFPDLSTEVCDVFARVKRTLPRHVLRFYYKCSASDRLTNDDCEGFARIWFPGAQSIHKLLGSACGHVWGIGLGKDVKDEDPVQTPSKLDSDSDCDNDNEFFKNLTMSRCVVTKEDEDEEKLFQAEPETNDCALEPELVAYSFREASASETGYNILSD